MPNTNKLLKWANDTFEIMLVLEPDTTPERERHNRRLLQRSHAFVEKLKGVHPAGDKAVDLLDDYFHYFDVGYRSPNNIDALQEDVISSLEKIIAELEA